MICGNRVGFVILKPLVCNIALIKHGRLEMGPISDWVSVLSYLVWKSYAHHISTV